MRIHHVTEKQRWEAARLAGSYAWSTRDRSLEDEGFVHAAHADQVAGVLERWWAGHPGPLVVLEIDTDRLTSPVREERVGDASYPHIHGPVNTSAVVAVRELPRPRLRADVAAGPRPTFASLLLSEIGFRMAAAVFVMLLGLLGAWLADGLWGDTAALVGLLVGVAVGLALVIPAARRRDARGS